MTWRNAYFVQAQNDYQIFREFKKRTDIAMCQKLHYLQMATEKLAKAFMSAPAGGPPPRVHTVIVGFLRMTKNRPEIRRQLGFGFDQQAYGLYINGLIEVAEQIERLAPVGNEERANPEYPWIDGGGDVVCPVHYTFPEFTHPQKRHKIAKFEHLTDGLFRIFA